MKITAILAITASTTTAFDPTQDGDRRWDETKSMLEFYNADAKIDDLAGYGCNCMAIGDRPLSESPGQGFPVDGLDGDCQKYKQCLKCARDKHGDACIPEMIMGSANKRYQMTIGATAVTCDNNAGTCKRDLCECSKQFAKRFRNVDWNTYLNEANSYFGGFDVDTQCTPSGGRTSPDHACCQEIDSEGPFTLYNRNLRLCCPDGSTAAFGDIC